MPHETMGELEIPPTDVEQISLRFRDEKLNNRAAVSKHQSHHLNRDHGHHHHSNHGHGHHHHNPDHPPAGHKSPERLESESGTEPSVTTVSDLDTGSPPSLIKADSVHSYESEHSGEWDHHHHGHGHGDDDGPPGHWKVLGMKLQGIWVWIAIMAAVFLGLVILGGAIYVTSIILRGKAPVTTTTIITSTSPPSSEIPTLFTVTVSPHTATPIPECVGSFFNEPFPSLLTPQFVGDWCQRCRKAVAPLEPLIKPFCDNCCGAYFNINDTSTGGICYRLCSTKLN